MYTQKKFEDQYTDFVQNALQRKHIIKKIIDRNQKKKKFHFVTHQQQEQQVKRNRETIDNAHKHRSETI